MPMVRRFVRGITRWPFLAILGAALAALTIHFAVRPQTATASPFTTPYWTILSPSPECACDNCECEGPSEWVTPGVSVRTGELNLRFEIHTTPGMLDPLTLGLRYRSMINGQSEFGTNMIPSWLMVREQILNPPDPNIPGGHEVHVYLPSGGIVTYGWDGTAYTTANCGFHATLTKNGSSQYELRGLYDEVAVFDPQGMLDYVRDANGNETDWIFSSARQFQSVNDNRGNTITATHDLEGYISALTTSAGDQYTFTRDTSGNLTAITTPATPDQSSGATTTLSYDGSNRLTAVQLGNGLTPWQYTYVGSSGSIQEVTGSTIAFSYTLGRTDVTDRNGVVTRYHYTGTTITKVDQYISAQSKYATEYRYSGNDLITIVRPLGNRIDFTRNQYGFVTERRQKTTDTNSSSSSDIVESWTYSSNRLASYTDAMGNTTSYGRDSRGNLTSISYPTVYSPTTQSNVSKSFTVNARGQITQETDEDGKVTEYEYYGTGTPRYGLLNKVKVDPNNLNLVTTLYYDPRFHVSKVTDPLSKDTLLSHDSLGRRTEVTDPLSQRTRWHYDGIGQLTSVEVENLDKDGGVVTGNQWLTTSYAYNKHGSLTSITEEIDASTTRTTTLEYDENQNRIRVTKPEGNKEKWTYNSRNLVATHVRGETSSVESTVEFTYDDNGNLTGYEDARDYDTTYTYDLFDRRTKTTNALGHYEEIDYNKASRVTEIRRYDATPNPDVLVQRATLYYDERGRRWKTSELFKDPGTTYTDAVTTIERFKTGRVRYVTNPRGKVSERQFDNAWRVSKVIDAMGNEVQNTYDAGGRRTAWSMLEKDGTTNVTHEYAATYDDLGRVITRTEKDRTNSSNTVGTTFDYDSRGNLVWLVNAKGDPTRFTFDGLGRMTKKEVALGYGTPIENFTSAIVTQWAFDKNNRLTSFKDDANNTSTWAFDAKDRPTSTSYPDNASIGLTYDAEDNVTQITDAAGNVVADTFDALGRNTARSVTRASGFVDTTSESRSYDALNRITAAADNDYRVEFTYGVIGLHSTVYEETQKYVGGTPYSKTVTTTYNGVGGMTSQTYPSSLALAYSYNDIDRLSTVSDGTNTIASFAYIGTRPKVTTFQNGTTDNRAYTGFRGEVASVQHKDSNGATLLQMDYAYDTTHDRMYERFGASGSAGDAFEYDKARRLTKAWMGSASPHSPSGNSYVETIVYNMDEDGNRTSVVATPYGQSASTSSYSAGSLNEYTSVAGTSQTHDSNGNRTDSGTLKFVYNYKNLICEVRNSSDNSLVATYVYDALGRRVAKSINGGATERYIYSGAEAVSVYDGTNTWKQDFVFDVTSLDSVLMLEQADVLDHDSDSNTTETTRSYFHRNALGSVMEVTDANQAEAVSYRYSPYGAVTITRGGTPQSTDPLGQHWSYTGRFYDEESGIYQFRRRDYDPEVGRFVQRDPITYEGGRNLYEYGGSDPIDAIDPWGLRPTYKKDPEKKVPGATITTEHFYTYSDPETEITLTDLRISGGVSGNKWWIDIYLKFHVKITTHVHERRVVTYQPDDEQRRAWKDEATGQLADRAIFSSWTGHAIEGGSAAVGYGAKYIKTNSTVGAKLNTTFGPKQGISAGGKMPSTVVRGVLQKAGWAATAGSVAADIAENYFFDKWEDEIGDIINEKGKPEVTTSEFDWDEFEEYDVEINIHLEGTFFPFSIILDWDLDCTVPRHRRGPVTGH